jgi:hypothetical protein
MRVFQPNRGERITSTAINLSTAYQNIRILKSFTEGNVQYCKSEVARMYSTAVEMEMELERGRVQNPESSNYGNN